MLEREGYDGLEINELEALVINELQESCKQLEYAISFYQSFNKSMIEEKEQYSCIFPLIIEFLRNKMI